jgi:hypothetical protein
MGHAKIQYDKEQIEKTLFRKRKNSGMRRKLNSVFDGQHSDGLKSGFCPCF